MTLGATRKLEKPFTVPDATANWMVDFDVIYEIDGEQDYLTGPPAGLGLDFNVDGSCTATVPGLWHVDFGMHYTQDATGQLRLIFQSADVAGGYSTGWFPLVDDRNPIVSGSYLASLTPDTQMWVALEGQGFTADPYQVNYVWMQIIRLA